jgi:hypothetical protein
MGEMQNIVYGEYLPTILGVDFMKTYGLIVEEESKYDPNVDATIFTSFGTAAFRQDNLIKTKKERGGGACCFTNSSLKFCLEDIIFFRKVIWLVVSKKKYFFCKKM